MDKKTINKWEKITENCLQHNRQFMQICNSFSRGFLGELLVFNQLLKTYGKNISKPENGILFYGSSKKGHDIELKLGERKIYINAKATTMHDKNGQPYWVRQHARNFAKIETKSGKTYIKPRKDYKKDFYYVYVDLKKWEDKGITDFYALSDTDAKKLFGPKYQRERRKKGFKIRNNDSDDFWIEYTDIKQFKDNKIKKIK